MAQVQPSAPQSVAVVVVAAIITSGWIELLLSLGLNLGGQIPSAGASPCA